MLNWLHNAATPTVTASDRASATKLHYRQCRPRRISDTISGIYIMPLLVITRFYRLNVMCTCTTQAQRDTDQEWVYSRTSQ